MRGTAAGEPVVSQANTEAFREGYTRSLGDKPAQRGKWIYDERIQKCVPADEYQAPSNDDAQLHVFTDRYMEGVRATDGTDIGSRTKRREYMKLNGYADRNDYSPGFREKVRKTAEREADKLRREAIGKAVQRFVENRRQRRSK